MTTSPKIAALSDEEIVRRFRQTTDPTLFNELVRRYHPRIQRACYQWLKDQEAAKDVSQEVLLRVFTRIETYRHEAPFAGWLRTIVHNRCMDHQRANKTQLHQELSEYIAERLGEELDTDELEVPLEELLEKGLEKVSGEEKLLRLLKYREGWSYQEIRETLNLTEGAAKMKIVRAKAKLQKFLE